MSYYDDVKEATDAIRARVPEIPKIGIVLGSGLGDFASSLGGSLLLVGSPSSSGGWVLIFTRACARRRSCGRADRR